MRMSNEIIKANHPHMPRQELTTEEWLELFQRAEAAAREYSSSPEQIEMRRRVAHAALEAGQIVLC